MQRLCLALPVITAASQVAVQDAAPGKEKAAVVSGEGAPSDAAMTNRLRAILDAMEHEDISVTVEARVVTLSGNIADPAINGQLEAVAERLEGVVAVNNALTTSDDIVQQINPALDRFRARIDQLVSRLPLFLIAFVVFGVILSAGLLLARQAF